MTEQQYLDAMKEIEHLWGSKLGTEEGERLSDLVDEVVAYETKHYGKEI